MEIYKNLSLDDLPNEEWRYIPDCDNLYMVSNMGRIKALASVRKFGNKKRKYREHIMKQFPNWQGYLFCVIRDLSQNKIRVSVHKAVCNAFHDNPSNLPCVNHKNEVKSDNRADNLEHCTYSYNITYGSRVGEKDVPVLQYGLDGSLIMEHSSVKSASEKTGILAHSICNATHGWSNSAGGFLWRTKGDEYSDILTPYKSPRLKSVRCYDLEGSLLKVYDSVTIAAKDLGLWTAEVSQCCKQQRESVKGYKFSYNI